MNIISNDDIWTNLRILSNRFENRNHEKFQIQNQTAIVPPEVFPFELKEKKNESITKCQNRDLSENR